MRSEQRGEFFNVPATLRHEMFDANLEHNPIFLDAGLQAIS